MCKYLVLIVSVCLVYSPETYAKRGLSSLFKAGRAASAVNGVKSYTVNTLTVQQLKSCLALEERIANSESQLEQLQPSINRHEHSLNSTEHDIQVLERYLKANETTKFYTQSDVDRFNSKVEQFNLLIASYNNELSEYQSLQNSYNKFVNGHNEIAENFKVNCAGKRYYEDDLALIQNNSK